MVYRLMYCSTSRSLPLPSVVNLSTFPSLHNLLQSQILYLASFSNVRLTTIEQLLNNQYWGGGGRRQWSSLHWPKSCVRSFILYLERLWNLHAKFQIPGRYRFEKIKVYKKLCILRIIRMHSLITHVERMWNLSAKF